MNNIHTEYPELANYSKAERYDYFIGCGGLYLAAQMARRMNLKKGDVVLDLGCGFGSASMFLAEYYGVTVIAVDLWFPPNKLFERIADKPIKSQIVPLHFDITQHLPFAENYFDAIFCMNSLFLFGVDVNFLNNLLGTLKRGGVFCVGSEGFNEEPQILSPKDIPEVYNFEWKWNVWDMCYSKYHSPDWWGSLIQQTNVLDITYCEEIRDGRWLWNDMAQNYKHYINEEILSLGAVIPQEKVISQVKYGKETGLFPTLYVISGIKK